MSIPDERSVYQPCLQCGAPCTLSDSGAPGYCAWCGEACREGFPRVSLKLDREQQIALSIARGRVRGFSNGAGRTRDELLAMLSGVANPFEAGLEGEAAERVRHANAKLVALLAEGSLRRGPDVSGDTRYDLLWPAEGVSR